MSDANLLIKLQSRQGAHYISAVVLGLNDALVELTGALAGFTIALHDNRLIVLAGLTTGVAATLSMAAAEFLSKTADETKTSPLWSAICTGIAYIITVAILLAPYFIIENPFGALALCLFFAFVTIASFTYILAKIRKTAFLPDFKRTLIISFSVALIAFIISWLADVYWGI